MGVQEIIVSVVLLSVFAIVVRYIYILFKDEGKGGGACGGCGEADSCPISKLYKDSNKEKKECGK